MANKIVGTKGDDVLKGTKKKDIIKGKGGNDVLVGKGGNDKLIGGSGKDKLKGGSGDDLLKGGGGKDLLIGGKDADDLFGGGGADIFKFNAGDGFYDNFDPQTPSPPDDVASFDDVIHDFKGIAQGGADKLDIPALIGSFGFSTSDFAGGLLFLYGDSVDWVGSMFLSGISVLDANDLI